MSKKLFHITLSESERHELETIVNTGHHAARAIKRARLLLLADAGKNDPTIAEYVGVCKATVFNVRRRYCTDGLQAVLSERKRPRSAASVDGAGRGQSDRIGLYGSPGGTSTLDDPLARRSFRRPRSRGDDFSHHGAYVVKKNELKPWQKREWCLGRLTSEFLMRMEALLDLYELPYDPRYPVLCFDERPCQLLGDTLVPIPMQPGKAYPYDHQYERHGTCCLLIAVEPLTGFRFAQVRTQRTKQDYAEFMQALVADYPTAEKIRLVQDNLNTHTAGSFYQAFEAETARQLARKFEYHYTPLNGSWLNMAEIELSAISKQCLDRRIPDQALLEREVLACIKERNENKITITWRFTTTDARKKLQRHYDTLKN